MSREAIVIGGIQVEGRPVSGGPHLQGYFLRPGGLQGVDGGVTVRRESVDIPGQHGEFDLPVLRGARVISISGMIIARTAEDLGNMRAALLGVGGSGGAVPINAKHQGKMLRGTGRLAATPEVTDLGDTRAPFKANFDLQFVCPNPRLYGETSRAGHGETSINRGNFPASPVIFARRVSGSGGYTVTSGNGGEFQVTAPLAVGSTHRIDLASYGVYAGSTRLTGAVGTVRPWTVPAGGPRTHGASAGIELSVETTDTYI